MNSVLRATKSNSRHIYKISVFYLLHCGLTNWKGLNNSHPIFSDTKTVILGLGSDLTSFLPSNYRLHSTAHLTTNKVTLWLICLHAVRHFPPCKISHIPQASVWSEWAQSAVWELYQQPQKSRPFVFTLKKCVVIGSETVNSLFYEICFTNNLTTDCCRLLYNRVFILKFWMCWWNNMTRNSLNSLNNVFGFNVAHVIVYMGRTPPKVPIISQQEFSSLLLLFDEWWIWSKIVSVSVFLPWETHQVKKRSIYSDQFRGFQPKWLGPKLSVCSWAKKLNMVYSVFTFEVGNHRQFVQLAISPALCHKYYPKALDSSDYTKRWWLQRWFVVVSTFVKVKSAFSFFYSRFSFYFFLIPTEFFK